MKLLYGTANTAKIKHMKDMLQGLDIEIIGLNDVNVNVSSIDESVEYMLGGLMERF